MVSVGELVAYLKLNADDFKKNAEDATKTTGTLSGSLSHAGAELLMLREGFNIAKDAVSIYTDAMEETYSSVEKFNQMTGATVEQGGKWSEIMEQMGLDLNDLTTSMRTLSNNAQSAFTDPESGAAESFRRLGVSVTDTNGNLKDTNTLILETISALQKMPAGVERNALAAETLGRNYMEINKLLNDNINITERYGATTTDVTKRNMEEYRRYKTSVNELNKEIGDLETEIGIGLAPVLTLFAKFLGDTVIPAINSITERFQYLGYIIAALSDDVGHVLRGEWGAKANNYSYEAFKQAKYLSDVEQIIPGITDKATAAAGAGWYEKLQGSTPGNTGTGSLSSIGGSGSGSSSGGGRVSGGGVGSSYGYTPIQWANISGVTREQFIGMSSRDQATLISAGLNPYQWNDGYYGARMFADNGTDISGSATQGGASRGAPYLDWLPIMAERLSGMNVSDSVRVKLNSYLAERRSKQVRYDEDTKGYVYDPSVNPLEQQTEQFFQYLKLFQAEYDRLTGGSQPMYDKQGKLIVYVQVDGKTIAQAVYENLKLLGVK